MPHTARAIRLRSTLVGSTAMIALVALACIAPEPRLESNVVDLQGSALAPDDQALDRARLVKELVAAHQRVRAAHHLSPFRVSGRLKEAADEHANDMALRRRMSHRGGDGSSPFQRMTDRGYAYCRAAENVAAGHRSVDAVMKGWMRSPGHRFNILGNYSEIGAACSIAIDGTPFWCVTFGEPQGG